LAFGFAFEPAGAAARAGRAFLVFVFAFAFTFVFALSGFAFAFTFTFVFALSAFGFGVQRRAGPVNLRCARDCSDDHFASCVLALFSPSLVRGKYACRNSPLTERATR